MARNCVVFVWSVALVRVMEIAPEPVPSSTTVFNPVRSERISIDSSTRSSVSGRGINTSGLTSKFKDQNSFQSKQHIMLQNVCNYDFIMTRNILNLVTALNCMRLIGRRVNHSCYFFGRAEYIRVSISLCSGRQGQTGQLGPIDTELGTLQYEKEVWSCSPENTLTSGMTLMPALITGQPSFEVLIFEKIFICFWRIGQGFSLESRRYLHIVDVTPNGGGREGI